MPYKSSEKQTQYQSQWMWRRRMEWILKNGPCSVCGSADQLRVVYKDPTERTVRVTSIWSRREEVRNQLLAKCVVLCHVCADSKRTEERQPKHGTLGRYDQGCREDCCRPLKAAAMAKYRAAKKLKETST